MPIVTGCSAAWLAHLLWEQGVVGSNPTIPTIVNQKADERDFFHQLFFLHVLGLLLYCKTEQSEN